MKQARFLLALKINKCDHFEFEEGKKEFITVSSQQTISDIFYEYHSSLDANNMKKGQLYEMTSRCTVQSD